MPEAKGVDAVERALQVLDACAAAPGNGAALADIARETGLYKSTIIRLAVSLDRFGYLVRTEAGRYRLGPSAWRIGAAYRSGFELSEVMRPELKLLSERTQETASYYIREGDARICLFRSEPPRSIRHAIVEGGRMSLDRGASGKVLLAFGPDAPANRADIRAAGHAVSRGERDPEVAAVSVPILTRSGQLLGALAVSGLITRFGDDRLPDLLAALRDSQASLAGRITF